MNLFLLLQNLEIKQKKKEKKRERKNKSTYSDRNYHLNH